MIKRVLLLLSVVVTTHTTVFAQDYFDDLKGNGNPVSLNLKKNFNLSARLNIGDKSAKLGFFKIYRLNLKKKNSMNVWEKIGLEHTKQNSFLKLVDLPRMNMKDSTEDFSGSGKTEVPKSSFKLNDLGFGLSVKGKTSDGIGNLFSKGSVSPETQLGLYGVYKNVKIKDDVHKYTFLVSPFFNYNFASYQVVRTDTTYKNQTSDTTLNGMNFGVSSFFKFYRNKKDQFIVGASITQSQLNNYDDLDKVEIKESTTKTDSSSGTVRTITTVNDNGYTYASGKIKQYWNTKIKCYLTYIPYQLDYRAALVVYPSVDINSLYAPVYNVGFGIHFLEKDNPTMSIAGVFFELNDIANAKNSKDPFMKHSFKIGVTAALNVTSLISK